MKKFAHLVKTAEVRGVMAYLVDSELVKVASEEDFDALVNEVSDALGDQDYDLNTVLNKTAEIIESNSMEKEANIPIGAGVGAIRGANLSEEEAERLREYYGKGRDANLTARNAGRGAVGGVGGGLLGAMAGGTVGAATRNPELAGAGGLLGGLGGTAYGIKHMTDKYSKGSRALKKDEE